MTVHTSSDWPFACRAVNVSSNSKCSSGLRDLNNFCLSMQNNDENCRCHTWSAGGRRCRRLNRQETMILCKTSKFQPDFRSCHECAGVIDMIFTAEKQTTPHGWAARCSGMQSDQTAPEISMNIVIVSYTYIQSHHSYLP